MKREGRDRNGKDGKLRGSGENTPKQMSYYGPEPAHGRELVGIRVDLQARGGAGGGRS